MNMRKSVLAVIIAGTCFSGMAHAGSVVGTGSVATTDLVFVEPSAVRNTLTPVSGLTAGDTADETVVARGVVDSLDGTPLIFATTFNNGDMSKTPGGRAKTIVSGANDPSHKLALYLIDKTPGTNGFSQEIDGKTYAVSGTPKVAQQLYDVSVFNQQNIAADTYTVSTISYVYTA